MEDYPNFLPVVKYLSKNNHNVYAVALYMLIYIDVDDKYLMTNILDTDGDGYYFEGNSFELKQQMESYHVLKKLGQDSKNKYMEHWTEKIKDIEEKKANEIYEAIKTLKKNNINCEYFFIDQLDMYKKGLKNYESDEQEEEYEYIQPRQFQYEEAINAIKSIIDKKTMMTLKKKQIFVKY